MRPDEIATRSFKIYPTTDQAAKYVCSGKMVVSLQNSWFFLKYEQDICECEVPFHLCFNAAILKDSNFNEVDRAECQFSTTATVLDNGSQVCNGYLNFKMLANYLLSVRYLAYF